MVSLLVENSAFISGLGFFYERWGDAPIHALGVSMSLRIDQVMQFEDMGYCHLLGSEVDR